jgi:hypothetical protein
LGYASIHTYIEGFKIKVAKATHDISNSADQDNSNGFFASIAYRADLQAQSVDLSPFIRYDIVAITTKVRFVF